MLLVVFQSFGNGRLRRRFVSHGHLFPCNIRHPHYARIVISVGYFLGYLKSTGCSGLVSRFNLAVEILRRLGFETRYSTEQPEIRTNEKEESQETGDGLDSILEIVSAATKEVPEDEWGRVPDDLSINVDHYLYGSKKTGK